MIWTLFIGLVKLVLAGAIALYAGLVLIGLRDKGTHDQGKFDWTDPAHPKEIAFFDRGPMDSTKLVGAGSWSAYWYNGVIVSSEIARGLDILQLTPSASLTQNEIDAAKSVRLTRFNTQDQPKLVWPTTFALARAYARANRQKDAAAARAMADLFVGGVVAPRAGANSGATPAPRSPPSTKPARNATPPAGPSSNSSSSAASRSVSSDRSSLLMVPPTQSPRLHSTSRTVLPGT